MFYAIYSSYILHEDQIIEGYICVNNELIRHVLDVNIVSSNNLQKKLKKYPLRYDFRHYLIMPTAIDTNVSLHSSFSEDWDFTSTFTKFFHKFLNFQTIYFRWSFIDY